MGKTKKIVLPVVCLMLLLSSIGLSFAGEAAEKKAVTAAEKWLALVDSGRYAESWEGTAALMKNAVTKEQWEQSLRAFRAPLGKMVERRLTSQQYTTSLPGAPDGEYVVIQYATTFRNKKSAVETVTPMLDKNGAWRVSGYYIK